MVVSIMIGRRVPKRWFTRQMGKAAGLITFQENIWVMISQSMSLGKRKCNQSGKGEWIQTKEIESEDLHYNIEWLKILIKGSEEFEKEEYEDSMKLYGAFDKQFKKDIKGNLDMKKHFKSKILNAAKVEEAYEKGYGSMGDRTIADKLLEMGILTHIEWIKDFELRKDDIKPDF